ncbi:hypothetical protein BJ322DRAFT_701608 [Thelephora terrestris]|uniref:Protein kinase domain-containing protein n=1 Tax=Thelephora terrestris TaxID=56493 RepID=A0A9P6HIW9_9AGAM|nr:hypothetical protein BJ322DRAFT_701608 [Thelephora terrestris]
MSSITRQPNKAPNGPNRRRSCSDSAISSDDDHERVEIDDRKGYRKARRQKLKVRRRWAQSIGLDVYRLPRFCGELTEHVRSVNDGPLDADGIREDEGFFSALTAPYEPPSPSRSPKIDWPRYCPPSSPAQKLNHDDSEARRVGCPPGLCTCAEEQDVDGDHSSDDDETILDSDHEVNHDLYTPSGKWENVRNSPIDGWETLMRIKVTPPLSVMLRKGVIAGNPITYISRLWNTDNVPRWKGFFSELALSASSRHLRPLQGTVVPRIINVYIEPGFVNVAMEPPHECFWIEASPDMPNILKHRCVEAFERLHAQGILHGDAELRHMLINADAKVTIIDFKAAATSVSLENVEMEEVGLRRATTEEIRLEMRKVKFKLDYDGARAKEREKLMRKKRGELRKEDVHDPPVDLHVLIFQWLEGCERPPTRFIVPGQTKEEVELAVERFMKKIGEMEGKESPIRETLGPVPPLEISRAIESTPKAPRSFAELKPLAVEESLLQPGPSSESQTEDRAVTHSAEVELASLTPGFGCFSPADMIKALSPPATIKPGNCDGQLPTLTVPSFDFQVSKWSDHSSGPENHKDTNQCTALHDTRIAPQSIQLSTFPVMRTFADVARKAIQVFGKIAGHTPVQSEMDPSQKQKAVNSSKRKRRLSESSASESSEYEARLRGKRLRRLMPSSLPSELTQQTVTPNPRAWSLMTPDQLKRTTKRKRESEGTSKLVWNTEQELRRKRRKLSELSDLSEASSSETEDDTARDRTARLRRTFGGPVTDEATLPLETLSTTRRDNVPRSDKAPSIIIRDYAYIPNKVPKAPYVPHPPTENRMAAERARHVCLTNAKACLEAGLSYPMTENQQGRLVPDLASSPYMFSAETFQEKQERKRREREMRVKGIGKAQRSFGSLKRNLDAQRTGRSAEFEERMLASWKDVSHRLKKKVASKVRFSMENLHGDGHGPSGGARSGVLRKMVRSVKETTGILKRPPPVKVFNYQARWEDEDDDAVSPKVGPKPERWDRSGGFGMLGVWVTDTRTKTEEAFREECALRVYESQRTIESVDGEWREEEERMEGVRRKEIESDSLAL